MAAKPKIIAALPSLGAVPLNHKIDCLRLAQSGRIKGWISGETCMLPFVRNMCIEQIYEQDPDFTHILFIDDDISNFDYNYIDRLLFHSKDIIGAQYVKRMAPYYFVGEPKDKDQFILSMQKGQICEMLTIGMGLTLIKREVFDALKEDTDEGPVWFTLDRVPRPGFEDEMREYIQKECEGLEDYHTIEVSELKSKLQDAVTFGQTSHIGSHLRTEDAVFCWRAIMMGFEVWQDCGLHLNHHGLTPVPVSAGKFEEKTYV